MEVDEEEEVEDRLRVKTGMSWKHTTLTMVHWPINKVSICPSSSIPTTQSQRRDTTSLRIRIHALNDQHEVT